MTYIPITCRKVGEVHVRARLGQPFIPQTLYPRYGANFSNVSFSNITGEIDGYASYLDNGTDQSFFTTNPPVTNGGTYYTGAKIMGRVLVGGEYHIHSVDQAYTDPDNTSAPAMTMHNAGYDTSPVGSISSTIGLVGPSAEGGDTFSWLEFRTGEAHILTADATSFTRKQAFNYETGEDEDAYAFVDIFAYDGESFWVLHNRSRVPDILAPRRVYLARFTPTNVGDPFDCDKFQITFDDSDLNDLHPTLDMGIRNITADNRFFVTVPDMRRFDTCRHLLISTDGTEYVEYIVTGNAAVEDFVTTNIPQFMFGPDGCPRYIGWAYHYDDWATGTYDLTASTDAPGCPCGGGRGHVVAKRRTLGPPIVETGNLIPSGDMQAGSDRFLPSGDQQTGDDGYLWREIK